VLLSPSPRAPAAAEQRDGANADHADRYITVEGRRVHYLDWGGSDKQPFVMLHGIARSAHRFDAFARQFQQDYHVVAMDLRGHGDSDWDPAGGYLVEDYVKDLETLVDELGLKDIVLTGASTGDGSPRSMPVSIPISWRN
jgi:pimeloyl-ACP methyl ester carboxylesterase